MNDVVLTGTVLTVDAERRVIDRGAVYVHNGRIEAVQEASAAPPIGFERANHVSTRGLITPGLIDLHNHLAYNTLPLWSGRDTAYATRYQWPGAPTYQSDVSNPAQALGIAAPAAALRFAEVKAVVGGVTAIQGSPPMTRAFPGWMVRNVEKESIGVDRPIFQSVLVATPAQLDTTAGRLRENRSFIYHLGEGVDPKLRSEYQLLRSHECVGAGLIGIHSTALTSDDFVDWGTLGGGAIVWSPFSNLWLYGGTSDVSAARSAGITVCLGSDWTPSGTRNVLGELKIAAAWNAAALGGALSDEDLVEMVTANPGDTLARPWGVQVGRLVPGALADIAVFTHSGRDDPWRTVLDATERQVRFVMVGGRPAYGNTSLLRDAGATGVEPITVTGVRRAIVMTLPDELLPDSPDLVRQANKSWADGLAELAAVWADPKRAVERARRQRAVGAEPFEFVPEFPPAGTEARALDDHELEQLVMPTFDGIGHDAAWRRSVVRRAPDHAPVLIDAMARF